MLRGWRIVSTTNYDNFAWLKLLGKFGENEVFLNEIEGHIQRLSIKPGYFQNCVSIVLFMKRNLEDECFLKKMIKSFEKLKKKNMKKLLGAFKL